MHQILYLLAVLVVVSCRECPLPCICRNLGRRSGRIRADCSNQSLYSLPTFNASSNVDEVDASGNNFGYIQHPSFKGMQNVAILNLSSSTIRDVGANAFQSLTKLWILDLSYNNLGTLPRSAFFMNYNLETLILRGNPLGHFGPTFYGMRIQKLDVRECGIGPELSLYFPMLRSLKLDSNKIHYMRPNMFSSTPYIRHLSLQDNNMNALPVSALSTLHNMTSLNVDHNPLSAGDLPELSLESLEILSARNCSLKRVSSAALEGCPKIRYLHLQQNNITTLSLPDRLDLVALNLSGNPLICDCALKPLFHWLVARDVLIDAACADSWGELFTDAMIDLLCDTLTTERSPEEDVGEGSGVYVAAGMFVLVLCVFVVVVVAFWDRIRMYLFTVRRRDFDSVPLNPSNDSL